MGSINIFAVAVAAAATFVLGGLWYSPLLFEAPWKRANGFADDDLKRGSLPVIFGLAFVFKLVIAANLAFFVSGPEATLQFALLASLAAGLGFAAMGLGVVAMFERRPPSYLLINGGYLTLSFLVMGLIIGLWR